jgi:PTS system nitrogen regulatory IIA component
MSEPTPAARTVCAHVVLDLVAKSAGDAIEQLAAGFANIPGAPAARTLAAAVLEREAQASTFLGHAAALPHARLMGVPNLAVAFGRARSPIPWTRDGDPVELVFLGVVPAAQPRHYLEFMRVLARALSNPTTAAALRAAPDEAAVRDWLRDHLRLQ